MNLLFIGLWMMFNHVLDDYALQGILAQMKQRTWWEENAPDAMYENDFVAALAAHAFSWTFMIMLPITYVAELNIGLPFILAFCVNMFIHAIVDDMKANKKRINLVTDQAIHIAQIFVTWYLIPFLI